MHAFMHDTQQRGEGRKRGLGRARIDARGKGYKQARLIKDENDKPSSAALVS
jgi:hypothetical protein